MTKHLRDRDMVILTFIEDYQRTHGYAPSVREIAKGVGLASTSAVHFHLVKMRALGIIDQSPRRARGIRMWMPETDVEAIDLATELIRAPRDIATDLPGSVVPGRCRRPGCRRPAKIGNGEWCGKSCQSIGWHVRRWLRDAAIEDEAIASVGAA